MPRRLGFEDGEDDDDVDLQWNRQMMVEDDPAVELQHRNAMAWRRQQWVDGRALMMSCLFVSIRPEDLLRGMAAIATRRLRWWFDAFLFGALRSKGDRVVARAKTERMRWWLEAWILWCPFRYQDRASRLRRWLSDP